MITAKLQAGLCNQLFQIAAAVALAKRNGDTAVFNIDECHTPNQGSVASKYRDTMYRDLPLGIVPDKGTNVYIEQGIRYKEIPYWPEMVIEGYFQSEKFFSDCKEDIKKLFSIFYEGTDEYADYTAVCVRRGDYLTKFSHIYPIPTIGYYKEAMRMIGENEKFLFFADDMQWCRDTFYGENIKYCPFTDDVQQLQLLTKCKNKILCNSTFGLWAALMGEKEGQKIIYPDVWFTKESGLDATDIVPERWTKISGTIDDNGQIQPGEPVTSFPGCLT